MRRLAAALALGVALGLAPALSGCTAAGGGIFAAAPQSTDAALYEAYKLRNTVGAAINDAADAGLIDREQHLRYFRRLMAASDALDLARMALDQGLEEQARAKLAEGRSALDSLNREVPQ